ncbi:MAG: hypothetical protein V2J16_05230 [Thermoleophilia bacterium]|jgi:hypothetical protein|nr:hypothetical protein [Thermoleophilia bacterium]
MRTFWIITLVLVTVLVMATAASASVRDSVASLVGDRSGAAEDSGDGGTFTVKAVKSGDQPETSDGWAVETAGATANAGEDDTYIFRASGSEVGADVEPAAQGDCETVQTFEGPDGPDAMDGGELEPNAGEDSTSAAVSPGAKAKGQAEETVAE